MKDKVYILAEILPETQARFPHIDLRKFKTLYDGWRAQGLRQKAHPSSYYTEAWRRGYLARKAANSLRQYIGVG